MKHFLAIVFLLLITATLTLAQTPMEVAAIDPQTEDQRAIKEVLYKAAHAYVDGKFLEAQRHAARALEIEPSNMTAAFFLARAIHMQHSPGVQSPENIATARQAIDAYQRVSQMDPEDDEAFHAVSFLYEDINENDLQYDWIQQRAYNGAVSVEKRVEAALTLANKDWSCSYKVTGDKANSEVIRTKSDVNIMVFRMPKDIRDFDSARQCATRGMTMIEVAITLDPGNVAAWSLKSILLAENASLSEMEGNEVRKKEYRNLAVAAKSREDELLDKKGRTVDANRENVSAAAPPDSNGKVGDVREGRTIIMPKPDYPTIARSAAAQGLVVVQVIIDDRGKVIAASAVSGHPLLRASAVRAAREAIFIPTILRGQPVKVMYKITYNFILELLRIGR